MKIFEHVSYDPQADACYLQISRASVASTEAKQDRLIIDRDADGNTVGIEILSIKHHRGLVDRLLLSQEPVEQCVSY